MEDYPDCLTKFGRCDLPSKITMSNGYEVQFIYKDIELALKEIEDDIADNPVGCTPCPDPGTKLERLDVLFNNMHQYSRYFQYYEYEEDFWHRWRSVPKSLQCTWYGSPTFFLNNTFILENNDAEIETTEDLSGYEPLSYWHFDTYCYNSVNDLGTQADTPSDSFTCSLPDAWSFFQFINVIQTPFGGKIYLNYDHPDDGDGYLLWNMKDPGQDSELMYNPHLFDPNGLNKYVPYDFQNKKLDWSARPDQLFSGDVFNCNKDNRLALGLRYPRIGSRTEEHPLNVELGGLLRVDEFDYLDYDSIRTTVIETGKFEQSGAFGCYTNPETYTDDPTRMYWTRLELDHYIHGSLESGSDFWKLYLPLETRTFAQYGENDQELISKVKYTWNSISDPIVSSMSSPATDLLGGDFTHNSTIIPFNSINFLEEQTKFFTDSYSNQCIINNYQQSEETLTPVLDQIEIFQDGVTYTKTFDAHDEFGFPTQIEIDVGGESISAIKDHINSIDIPKPPGIPDIPSIDLDYKYIVGFEIENKFDLNFSSGQGFDIKYTYDNLMNITDVNTNGLSTSMSYDVSGNLETVTSPEGLNVSFSGYEAGRPKNIEYGNISVDVTYDPIGSITSYSLGDKSLITDADYYQTGDAKQIYRNGLESSSIEFEIESASLAPYSIAGSDHHEWVKARVVTTGNREYKEEYDGMGRVWRSSITSGSATIQKLLIRDMCGQVRYSYPLLYEGDYSILDKTNVNLKNSNIYFSKHFVDSFGRPVYSENSSGVFTHYGYQSSGSDLLVTETTNPKSSGVFSTTNSYTTVFEKYFSGPAMLLTKMVGPITPDSGTTKTTTYTHDNQGNVIEVRVKDNGGKVLSTSLKRDSQGNVLSVQDTVRGSQRYTYNSDGIVIGERHGSVAQGLDASYSYNDSNKIITVTADNHTGADLEYKYGYTVNDTLLDEVTGKIGGTQYYSHDFSYNSDVPMFLSKLVENYAINNNSFSFDTEYTYDNFGQLAEIEYDNNFTISYERDGLGRITKVKRDGQDIVDGAKYFADGSAYTIGYGNNMVNEYFKLYGAGVPLGFIAYNTGDETISRTGVNGDGYDYSSHLDFNSSDDLIWHENYSDEIDIYGNPHKIEYNLFYEDAVDPGTSFNIYANYDFEQQLTQVEYMGDNKYKIDYEYDLLGNRKNIKNWEWVPEVSPIPAHYTTAADSDYNYNSQYRLSSVTEGSNENNYSYDDQGNMISSPTHEYKYDFFNRLIEVDNGKVKFYYSHTGSKIMKVTEDELIVYFYGAGGLTCERKYSIPNYEEVSSTYYIYANGQVVAQF